MQLYSSMELPVKSQIRKADVAVTGPKSAKEDFWVFSDLHFPCSTTFSTENTSIFVQLKLYPLRGLHVYIYGAGASVLEVGANAKQVHWLWAPTARYTLSVIAS